MSSFASRSARSTGIANPMPTLPAAASPAPFGTVTIAELMPDEPRVAVDERSAAVTRIDRGVGLDRAHELRALRPFVARDRELAVERADDAGGDRAGQAERRAESDDGLTDLGASFDDPMAMTGASGAPSSALRHGEVGVRIPSDDRGARGRLAVRIGDR